MKRLLIIAILFLCTSFKEEPVPGIVNPRCEMLVNPLGIDAVFPRLSWEIVSAQRNVEQTAYQVIVSSSPEKLEAGKGDLWNSGKVTSDQSVHVNYAGVSLKSRMSCFWKVKTWTNHGESAWSEPAKWTMGLINYVDWKGRWIGLDKLAQQDRGTQFSRLSARYLRKEFNAAKAINKATIYIIGLGLYELYINGSRVGDQVLAPGPTDYNKGVKYNTFDVTDLLKQGKNAIGTILGNGRYFAMRQDYKPYKIKTFGYPKMLMNLDIEYADGSKETISTDDTWRLNVNGPIRANNEYDGEEYDATKEFAGWAAAGFNDALWPKATFVQEPGGTYEAQMNSNMKVMETIKPVSVKRLKSNTYILDMGQNMAGWLRLRATGKRGDKITLRFAETLQPDGGLYVRNLRDALVTDIYTMKGTVKESWEPSFVYHGFRYAEITGYPGTPTVNDFDGRVVYDDMITAGDFTTSNATINHVYKNAYWGIRSNYKGMPVDCPQRNERQPWLGDRTTGAYGESFIFDNGRLYAKWLDDIRQSQKEDGSIPDVAPSFWRYYGDNVTWPGTYIAVADMLYTQYGDETAVAEHYPYMKKWMDYMAEKYSANGIITKDKYGDWCVPPESKELIHARDPARITDGELIATATYIRWLSVMERFAKLLDKTSDAKSFAFLSDNMKAAFNRKFYNTSNAQYSNNTVTANLLPLMFGIVPAGSEDKVLKNIGDKILIGNNGHISTGVIGTQWLMRGLSSHGRADIAYKIASNTDYPSWGYMAENGATTIWELWNGNTADPEMNSQNHVMLLGDLVVWYYENLAGIKTSAEAPGFKKIIMKPEMADGLNSAKAMYRSMYGIIKSSWRKSEGQFSWDITVPPNTKALIYIPAGINAQVTESGKPAATAQGVRFVENIPGRQVFEAGSGNYSFTSPLTH
ncbi:alpha-L-rhamnosidase [Hufsiella ginkgonis]|uniref:alpha-L-rhamnosidase n=1 Tax=Hufsiella ginkgonis TaxID=2695274 RepID=A0A7K1XW35_9SPHI|nr:alpha-L-rhamnosidase [Hufsiella ginkgonis]MXV15205.1 family 78 glycoside hydrolase catalytic domain [Hufsiella ginkgonis]